MNLLPAALAARESFVALEYWEALAERSPKDYAEQGGPEQWWAALLACNARPDEVASLVASGRAMAERRPDAAREPAGPE